MTPYSIFVNNSIGSQFHSHTQSKIQPNAHSIPMLKSLIYIISVQHDLGSTIQIYMNCLATFATGIRSSQQCIMIMAQPECRKKISPHLQRSSPSHCGNRSMQLPDQMLQAGPSGRHEGRQSTWRWVQQRCCVQGWEESNQSGGHLLRNTQSTLIKHRKMGLPTVKIQNRYRDQEN